MNFLEKFAGILFRPKDFFAEVKKETSLAAAANYFLVAVMVTLLLTGIAMIFVLGSSTINATTIGITVPILVAQLIAILIFAAISQALGRLFFGAAGSYQDTLRVYLYDSSTGMIISGIAGIMVTFLPDLALPIGIIGLVLGLYLIYVLMIGLSVVHEISMLRALGMSIPGIIIIALAISVAAAGAAYLWIIHVQSLMAENIAGSLSGTIEAQQTRFCIDSVWNSTTAMVFTLRNCGSYDVTQSDFAQTGYYVDGIKMTCTPDVTSGFNVYDVRTVTCPAGSYGTCADGKCPKRTITVTAVSGKPDNVEYQYVSG